MRKPRKRTSSFSKREKILRKPLSRRKSGSISFEPYLAERETLALCICLVDTNIPPQDNDTQLVTYLKQMQRPFLVVGTKADKLSNNQLGKSVAALKKAHEVEEILPVSAKTDAGTKALWAKLMEVAE